MLLIRSLGAAALFSVVIIGCRSNTSDKQKKGPANSPRPLVLTANNYTGGEWSKGVFKKEGRTNKFYFLADKEQPIELNVGDTVVFAKTGKAKITKIDSLTQNKKVSVFVTVDKDLDPEGDGFPKRILVE